MHQLLPVLPALVGVATLISLGTTAPAMADATTDVTSVHVVQRPNCNNPQTQAEMNACAGLSYQAADRRLNQVYQRLLPKLTSSRRQKLITAQQTWIKFRDSSCAFERSEVEGGTMEPMIYNGCLAETTRQRTAQLESYLVDTNK